ncbi:MAG TPA: DUF2934 domain-containing protein [Nitrospira sp.]|nr:DUF2934 domain-containing protein [Nitrospira sp.]
MGPMRPKPSKKISKPAADRAKATSQIPLPEELHEQIAKRAYELYERRICKGALDDWLQAEQEILRETKTRKAHPPHRGGYASEEQE